MSCASYSPRRARRASIIGRRCGSISQRRAAGGAASRPLWTGASCPTRSRQGARVTTSTSSRAGRPTGRWRGQRSWRGQKRKSERCRRRSRRSSMRVAHGCGSSVCSSRAMSESGSRKRCERLESDVRRAGSATSRRPRTVRATAPSSPRSSGRRTTVFASGSSSSRARTAATSAACLGTGVWITRNSEDVSRRVLSSR